jgi:hypothetical protein
MACIISLIDPTKNKITKTLTTCENYLNSEGLVKELNDKLNKGSNKKGLYWKITAINV